MSKNREPIKITLTIAPDVYADLKSNMVARQITGSLYGVADSFLVSLISKIEDGQKDIELKRRKKEN